jgi:hypothetical protein
VPLLGTIVPLLALLKLVDVPKLLLVLSFPSFSLLAIIHKRNEPNLAIDLTIKYILKNDSCPVLPTNRNSLFKYGDFLFLFLQNMATCDFFFFKIWRFSQFFGTKKMPFYHSHWVFFWSPKYEN